MLKCAEGFKMNKSVVVQLSYVQVIAGLYSICIDFLIQQQESSSRITINVPVVYMGRYEVDIMDSPTSKSLGTRPI